MIDTAQESIIFPFIFIVKFSDRLLSSKMWFFVWVGDMDRKYFLTIWTEMILVAQFIQHFPIFLAGHPVLWTLGYSIKKQNSGGWGGWGNTFLNPRPLLKFFISLLYPWKLHKIVLDTLEIPSPKTKNPALEILRYFFLVTLGDDNSTSFLVNTWKFHMLFLWYPANSISSTPTPQPSIWFFLGIAHFKLSQLQFDWSNWAQSVWIFSKFRAFRMMHPPKRHVL